MSYCLTPFFSACTGAADPALLKCFVQHVSQPYLFYQHSSAVSKSPTEAQHCFKKKKVTQVELFGPCYNEEDESLVCSPTPVALTAAVRAVPGQPRAS